MEAVTPTGVVGPAGIYPYVVLAVVFPWVIAEVETTPELMAVGEVLTVIAVTVAVAPLCP
jgi:hypothetical protein